MSLGMNTSYLLKNLSRRLGTDHRGEIKLPERKPKTKEEKRKKRGGRDQRSLLTYSKVTIGIRQEHYTLLGD